MVPQVIKRTVTGDGDGPAAETVAVATEGMKVLDDMQPGLGSYVFSISTNEHLEITQHTRLNGLIQSAKRLVVTFAGSAERRRQFVWLSMVWPGRGHPRILHSPTPDRERRAAM